MSPYVALEELLATTYTKGCNGSKTDIYERPLLAESLRIADPLAKDSDADIGCTSMRTTVACSQARRQLCGLLALIGEGYTFAITKTGKQHVCLAA